MIERGSGTRRAYGATPPPENRGENGIKSGGGEASEDVRTRPGGFPKMDGKTAGVLPGGMGGDPGLGIVSGEKEQRPLARPPDRP